MLDHYLKDQKLIKLELEQLKLSIEKRKIKEDNIHLEMDLIDKSKELANYSFEEKYNSNFLDQNIAVSNFISTANTVQASI